MNQDNERDELAEALHGRFPTGARSFMVLDANMAHAIATAIQSAGYRKPRTITTAEELDALPVHTVIRTAGTPSLRGRVAEKVWVSATPDADGYFSSWEIADCSEYDAGTDELDDLPADVLWEPEA